MVFDGSVSNDTEIIPGRSPEPDSSVYKSTIALMEVASKMHIKIEQSLKIMKIL